MGTVFTFTVLTFYAIYRSLMYQNDTVKNFALAYVNWVVFHSTNVIATINFGSTLTIEVIELIDLILMNIHDSVSFFCISGETSFNHHS